MHRLIVGLFIIVAWTGRASGLKLGLPFSDHMVVQAGMPIHVWGKSAPGSTVTVEFAGESGAASADESGTWHLDLPALDYLPDGSAQTMTARSDTQTVRLEDVLIGEVWLCSGQSNMRFTLGRHAEPRDADAPLLYPATLAAANEAQIRLLNVSGGTPAGQVWAPCRPNTVADFSAIGYHFGRALHNARHVPIGLVDLGKGGAAIRTFISEKSFYAHPTFGENYPPERRPGFMVGGVYRQELESFAPFSVRGVLWYQGESDVSRAFLYPELLTCMINDWRALWSQPDLPFLVVQLPPWERRRTDTPATTVGYRWANLRQAQAQVVREVPETYLLSIADLGERLDIHPRRKREVGERLAALARSAVYDEPIPVQGPEIVEATRSGDTITLTFSHTEGGLLARGGTLNDFEIAGSDGAFQPAAAEIISYNQIRINVVATSVTEQVRYDWRDFYDPTLFNGDGRPAAPFLVHVADRPPAQP